MKKSTSKSATNPKLDHPDQAIDTDLPDDSVDEDAFKSLQEAYEGDPDD